MTLRIIEPFAITETNIESTNVALETAWTAGTYSLGDVRRVAERLFEVSAATTTQQPGLAASTEWFDKGPANRYAAFDLQFGAGQYRVIETITSRAESIVFTLSGLPRISSMAFFGLAASRVEIFAATDAGDVPNGEWDVTSADGSITITSSLTVPPTPNVSVSDDTITISEVVNPGIVADVVYDIPDATSYLGSMWRWFFVPSSFERKYANFDLNIPQGATVKITIANPGNTAKIGTIVMGIADGFGTVEVGSSVELRSRSVKKTEGALTSLLRRAPSARVGYDVHLNNYQAEPFWRAINDLDGVAAVFAGPDENREFLAYGVVASCQTVSHVRGIAKVKLEVETL